MERAALPWILVALAAALTGCDGGGERPRGVLLISIDSLRADHLSSYGYRSKTAPAIPTSPRIDERLAAQGLVFERAVSTTSWTLPAHMALMTGMPDELHGVNNIDLQLPPSRTTLAETFRADGWRTAGFWSGINLHPWFGFDRGFERYVDCSNVVVPDPAVFGSKDDGSGQTISELQRMSHQGVTSPKLVREFETWFDGIGEDEPFFAFVHFWDVHYDYAAPPEDDVFFPEYRGTLDGANYGELGKQATRDPDDVARLIALYDAEIRYTDKHVSLLLDRLARAGRLDDTLVILTSDHGEEFFEHGKFGHYHTLYEEVVRVPLILRWPAGIAAGRTGELTSLADVAPTILELCDLARPGSMWGRSVARAGKEALAPRIAPLELTFRRPENFLRGAHGGDHKVLQASRDAAATYFDLAADPGELHPIAHETATPAMQARMSGAQAGWDELKAAAQRMEAALRGDLPSDLNRGLELNGYTGK